MEEKNSESLSIVITSNADRIGPGIDLLWLKNGDDPIGSSVWLDVK